MSNDNRGEPFPGPAGTSDPRLDELLRRIAAIEQRLGIAPPAPALLDRLADLKRSARTDQPPIAAAAASPDETGEFEAIVETVPAAAPQTAPPIAPPMPPAPHAPIAPPVFVPRAPIPPRAPRPRLNLEKFVGARLFAALGALGVVIGIALLFKIAIDNEWIKVSAATRCIGAAGFGFVLLGLGELARRKINAIASAGVSAAGIGTIYGAAWAAYVMYELVGVSAAFAMLAAASAIGIFVAARANLVSVAIISLLGAYVAPLIARAENPAPIVLPLYLFALLALGLGLAALRARPFRPLRGVVWWATVLMGTGAVINAAHDGQPWIGLGFLGLVWAAVHAELWYGARKSPESEGEVRPGGITWRTARPIMSTFATTMWCAAIGVWSLSWTKAPLAPPDWSVTAALMLAAGAIAFILAGNLRAMIDTPETDGERLGAALMTQAGALVIATVAIGLTDKAEVLAGVALGVGAVFAGRWIKSRALDVYGLIVLALTVGRLVVYDTWAGGMMGPGTAGPIFLGLSISDWTFYMLGAAAGWVGAGVLLERSQKQGGWRSLGIACIGLGLCIAYAAFLSPHSQATSLLVGGMLLGAAMLGVAAALRSDALITVSMGTIALTGAITLLVQATRSPETADWPWQLGGVVMSRWGMILLLSAFIWCAAAAVFVKWMREFGAHYRGPAVLAACAAVIVTLVSFLAPGSAHGPVAWVWLGISIGVLVVHRFAGRLALDVMALLGVLGAAGLWIETYAMGDWLASPRPIGLHAGLLLALSLSATLALAARQLWRRVGLRGAPTFAEVLPAVVGAALLLLFASTSLEVRRAAQSMVSDPTAQRAALSIWWGLFAIGLIIAGFARRAAIIRHSGLALMTIAAAKVVVLDSSEVEPIWRVVMFIALGLMMLGIAVGYAKVSANLDRETGGSGEPAEA